MFATVKTAGATTVSWPHIQIGADHFADHLQAFSGPGLVSIMGLHLDKVFKAPDSWTPMQARQQVFLGSGPALILLHMG